MEQLRKRIALALLLTVFTASVQGQPSYTQNDSSYSPAYMESSQAAHWSAYVPIGVMVAAAIWFGVADRKCDGTVGYSKSKYKCGSHHHSAGTCSH